MKVAKKVVLRILIGAQLGLGWPWCFKWVLGFGKAKVWVFEHFRVSVMSYG